MEAPIGPLTIAVRMRNPKTTLKTTSTIRMMMIIAVYLMSLMWLVFLLGICLEKVSSGERVYQAMFFIVRLSPSIQ